MTNDIEITLNLLHNLLSPVSTNWIVIGTTSLYLHGLPVTPQDIDILCDTQTAIAFEEQLSAYRTATKITSGQDKFTSRFSQYIINGTPVELMGNLLVNTKTDWINLREMIGEPKKIQLNNRIFLVPDIADQLKIYTLFGREKDQTILAMLSQQS
jgi:hypothetical protein